MSAALLATTGLASPAEWADLPTDDQAAYLDALNARGVALQARIIAEATHTTPRAVLALWVRQELLTSAVAFAAHTEYEV